MTTAPLHKLQFDVSEDTKKRFESAAAGLHLSPSAFLVYLLERQRPGVDPLRLDKMVGEIFGRYGDVMRRLAQ